MEAYMTLDDSILDEIDCSDDPRLAKAKEILNRIHFRQLYKCAGEKGLDPEKAPGIWKQITAANILQYADQSGDIKLQESDIALKKYVINHGLKDGKHPLESVKFFDKKSGSTQAYLLPLRKQESMVPKYNQSWTVRCFVKP